MGFWIYNFSRRILEKSTCWKHCKYKEWVSIFLGSWGMNRIAKQTNRPRTASRFTRFVCPALRFIPHEPRKKDTHSLIGPSIETWGILRENSLFCILCPNKIRTCGMQPKCKNNVSRSFCTKINSYYNGRTLWGAVLLFISKMWYHLASMWYHLGSRWYHLASRWYHLASRWYHLGCKWYHLELSDITLKARWYHLIFKVISLWS